MDRRLAALLVAVPVAAASALALTVATGAPAKKATADYIEGTVTSAGAKPEAGVWVIAEAELGTTYRKIVVTDSKGRFVLPQLPNAKYRVGSGATASRTPRRSARGPASTGAFR